MMDNETYTSSEGVSTYTFSEDDLAAEVRESISNEIKIMKPVPIPPAPYERYRPPEVPTRVPLSRSNGTMAGTSYTANLHLTPHGTQRLNSALIPPVTTPAPIVESKQETPAPDTRPINFGSDIGNRDLDI
jgi:hypothetical protein